MAYQLSKINQAIRSDVKGFLEECDAAYQRKIDDAAEQIIRNLPNSPLVLLSGPSGSGKTTTAMKIDDALEKRGVITQTISMDNYFPDRLPGDHPPAPPTEAMTSSPPCAWTWSCSTSTLTPWPGERRSAFPATTSAARCGTPAGAPPSA